MGMSASQARLLYITAQLNNLSLKGQQVSDAKIRLSMDTQDAQEEYINALNSTRLFINTTDFSTDGSVESSEYITLENLAAMGYYVSDGSNILGYSWEEVETGEYETVETDGYNPNYSTAQTIINEINEDNNFDDESELQVCTYTTSETEEAQTGIYVKSDAGLSAILEYLESKSTNTSSSDDDDDTDEDAEDDDIKYIVSQELYDTIAEEYKSYFLVASSETEDTAGSEETDDVINADDSETTDTATDTATITSYRSKDDEVIGWEHNTAEVPVYETVLVEDLTYSISSIALEEGLRSGALQLVQQVSEESTETISLNGLFFETTSLSTCSIITDETEDDAAEKAEAEYNKAMEEIQQKDKRYELDQEKIDTEYNALIQEEESIQSVLENNIDRSFKAFSA